MGALNTLMQSSLLSSMLFSYHKFMLAQTLVLVLYTIRFFFHKVYESRWDWENPSACTAANWYNIARSFGYVAREVEIGGLHFFEGGWERKFWQSKNTVRLFICNLVTLAACISRCLFLCDYTLLLCLFLGHVGWKERLWESVRN